MTDGHEHGFLHRVHQVVAPPRHQAQRLCEEQHVAAEFLHRGAGLNAVEPWQPRDTVHADAGIGDRRAFVVDQDVHFVAREPTASVAGDPPRSACRAPDRRAAVRAGEPSCPPLLSA